METRALRYFQMVATCGSYSRGSELLHISQPAVSRTIRHLEDELGTTLFNRHGHGVTLTPAGQVLLERSQVFLRQLEQTKAEIRSGESTPSGVIAFAIPPAAGSVLAPALIERFAAEYPNVFVNIVGGFSGHIHEWLVRGQVDLACVHEPLPQRGFDIAPLVREEVYLVGRRDKLPFARDFARIDDLARVPLILPSRANASRRLIESWTAQGRVPLNVKLEVDDHSITRAMVRRGVGFTLLTRGAIDGEAQRRELHAIPFRPRAHWSLALLTCANSPRAPIVGNFIAALHAVTRQLVVSGTWSAQLADGA